MGSGGGTGIRSMRCLILDGKRWDKQCKAIKDPQAPSKVSYFALSKQIDGPLPFQPLCYLAPVGEGLWSNSWNMGPRCLSCSVPDCNTGCCLKHGGNQSSSRILSPPACLFCLKNKPGGWGLSLPIHSHTA